MFCLLLLLLLLLLLSDADVAVVIVVAAGLPKRVAFSFQWYLSMFRSCAMVCGDPLRFQSGFDDVE